MLGAIPDEEFFPSEKDQEAFCPSNVENGGDAVYYDANTGVVLDNDKVNAARQDDLSWIRRAEGYVKRPISECLEVTGKQPITLKWLDRNKGDAVKPNYSERSEKETRISASTHVVFQHAVWETPEARALRHQPCTFLWQGSEDCIHNAS